MASDGPGDPVAASVAAYTVVAAHSFLGRDGAADRAMRAALPTVSATLDALPYGRAIVQVSAATSRVFAGRLLDAEQLGLEMQEAAVHQDDPWVRPRSSTVLGLVALLRGRVQTATEHLRRAMAALNELDAMFLPYNASFFARAAALSGDALGARRALSLQADAPRYPLYEADWQIARAAVLAAERRTEAAATRALSAARTAANQGQWGIAALAAHDAARYGGSRAAVELTATAAVQTGALLPRLMAEHADARSAADPDRLAAVSDAFAERGVLLFAAEAAYAGARAHRDRGRAGAAVQLSIRAAELHGRCENAAVPWALGPPAAHLTSRQQQVALLAAARHSDSDIAGALGVTVRTVQTHLTQVYGKLQISSRRDIAAALTTRWAT